MSTKAPTDMLWCVKSWVATGDDPCLTRLHWFTKSNIDVSNLAQPKQCKVVLGMLSLSKISWQWVMLKVINTAAGGASGGGRCRCGSESGCSRSSRSKSPVVIVDLPSLLILAVGCWFLMLIADWPLLLLLCFIIIIIIVVVVVDVVLHVSPTCFFWLQQLVPQVFCFLAKGKGWLVELFHVVPRMLTFQRLELLLLHPWSLIWSPEKGTIP